jgi:hypothetical protein
MRMPSQAQHSPIRRYPLIALATATVVALLVGGFNLVVGPFGTFRLAEISGVNAAKPEIATRVRLAKAYDVRRLRPTAIVLGTSRSHLALRMNHPGWGVPAGARYNLAFDGATPHEMFAYLQHAEAVTPLRQVVLGLDTWHLTGGVVYGERGLLRLERLPDVVGPDFDPRLLYRPHDKLSAIRVRLADLRLLLSWDTAAASVRTLLAQGDAEPSWLAADGQRLGELFFRRTGEMFHDASPEAYFRAIDRQEIGFKTEPPPRGHPRSSPRDAAGQELTKLGYIAKIVAFCRDEDIDLRIFITPAHAHQLEIGAEIGETPAVEAGKHRLVAILAEDAARHPGASPFPLIDFSGYSAITTEPVPPSGSRAEMANYWDSSHFKEHIGDLVLDRLFGVSEAQHPVPDDFGVALTTDSIESALATIRRDARRYRIEHPADVAEIAEMVALARGSEGIAGTPPPAAQAMR